MHTFGFNIENEKETYNLVDWAIKAQKQAQVLQVLIRLKFQMISSSIV